MQLCMYGNNCTRVSKTHISLCHNKIWYRPCCNECRKNRRNKSVMNIICSLFESSYLQCYACGHKANYH